MAPVEVVKQRAQTYHSTSLTVFCETIANGGLRSLYRGYGITILREIPFSLIQFPLWEYLKIQYIKWDHSNTKIQPYQSMICGSVAGAVPRVLWISIGGAIFLGGYEKVLSILQ
ncbi:hypothetical protein BLOT_016754 [Blomia tropicalis]|nr:hypothetical protein BLOT_016754 [Blomia tropicalis]